MDSLLNSGAKTGWPPASGYQLRVIGRWDADHDEFLFASDDPTAAIDCVHLTGKAETNPDSQPLPPGYAKRYASRR